MKWFKHYSDSYSNLKLVGILSRQGLEGYGLFWICVEMTAQQGKNGLLPAEKGWKAALSYVSRKEEKYIQEILEGFAEQRLIEKKALDKGHLHIPKLLEYSDDYTDKLRRKSVQGTDKVPLDKSRIDKNIYTTDELKKLDDERLRLIKDKTL